MEAVISDICEDRRGSRGERRRSAGPNASARFSRKRPNTPKQRSGVHRRRRKKIQW